RSTAPPGAGRYSMPSSCSPSDSTVGASSVPICVALSVTSSSVPCCASVQKQQGARRAPCPECPALRPEFGIETSSHLDEPGFPASVRRLQRLRRPDETGSGGRI